MCFESVRNERRIVWGYPNPSLCIQWHMLQDCSSAIMRKVISEYQRELREGRVCVYMHVCSSVVGLRVGLGSGRASNRELELPSVIGVS